jgi:hypothetical protein
MRTATTTSAALTNELPKPENILITSWNPPCLACDRPLDYLARVNTYGSQTHCESCRVTSAVRESSGVPELSFRLTRRRAICFATSFAIASCVGVSLRRLCSATIFRAA